MNAFRLCGKPCLLVQWSTYWWSHMLLGVLQKSPNTCDCTHKLAPNSWAKSLAEFGLRIFKKFKRCLVGCSRKTCNSAGVRSSTRLVWITTKGLRPAMASVYAFGTGFCRTYNSGASKSRMPAASSISLCRSASCPSPQNIHIITVRDNGN